MILFETTFARLAHSYVNETLHIFNSGSHCTRMETLPRAMIRFSVHTLKCTLKCFRCAVVARAEKAVEFSNIIKTNKFRENCAPRVFAQLLNLLHSVSARIKQCNTKNYIKSARSVPINPEPWATIVFKKVDYLFIKRIHSCRALNRFFYPEIAEKNRFTIRGSQTRPIAFSRTEEVLH